MTTTRGVRGREAVTPVRPQEKTIFFAYPSSPAIRREAIVTAATSLQDQTGIRAVTWESLRQAGNLLISKVLTAIDDAELIVVDVSESNDNVLFELGYAIGSRKKVWLIRDDSIEAGNRWWKQASALTPIEYSRFKSSADIVKEYWTALPLEAPDFFSSTLSSGLSLGDTHSLLYLKSNHETEAEARVTPRILEEERQGIKAVVADPRESAFDTLAWYTENIYRSAAVIAHFCSGEREGHVLHNSRLALLSGLARGMGKPLLMLAEVDYHTPLDYMDLLKSYSTGSQCRDLADRWLKEQLAPTYRAIVAEGERRRRTRLADELKDIHLGEHVAEHEHQELGDYFVQTAQYLQILDGTANIFVGQKGTGKTANFYFASETLADDKRNLVCVIKPPSYELEDTLSLLRQWREESRGYLIESIWKFLIYTEVARAAYEELQRKPPFAPDSVEGRFMYFVENDATFILDDFAVRLEEAVMPILQSTAETSKGVREDRARISERLHETLLGNIRRQLTLLLSDRERVAILVDNLDKAWERGTDVEETSLLILGLLSSIGRIEDDFRRETRRSDGVNVTITVFLRSDIWEQVKRVAREPDKIPVTFLRWDSADLLRRVVEDRYVAHRKPGTDPRDLWVKYFPEKVRGLPPDDFALSRVLPRPRDFIFLLKQAVATAINARRDRVSEGDVLAAEESYSQFAFEALVVENVVRYPRIEEVLFEFAGVALPLTRSEVEGTILSAGTLPENVEPVLQELIRSSFIGFIDADGRPRFVADPDDDRRMQAMMRRAESTSGELKLTIHPAYRSYLSIAD